MGNFFKQILLKTFELPLPASTAEDLRLAEEFRSFVSSRRATLPDQPTGSERAWYEFHEQLRRQVMNRDPREFLRWDVIRGTMFVSNPSYVAKEFRYLKNLDTWESRWKPALQESPVGRPRPYPRFPKTSGNLVHHAYHLALFERAVGQRVESFGQVFEFGGGYGSMARLCRRVGFSGDYIIYDFPYFSALQRFYLRSIGMPAALGVDCDQLTDCSEGEGAVCCVFDQGLLRERLANSVRGGRLFLATWSFSEAPLATRDEITPLLSNFDYFLVGFQHRFQEIDNVRYFRDWVERLGDDFEWSFEEMSHLSGSSYLFGKRRRG